MRSVHLLFAILALAKADERQNHQSEQRCSNFAATVAPCLEVSSPTSKLTTLEESGCCEALQILESAGCLCLGGDGQSLGWNVAAFGNAYKSCTGLRPSCPTEDAQERESQVLRVDELQMTDLVRGVSLSARSIQINRPAELVSKPGNAQSESVSPHKARTICQELKNSVQCMIFSNFSLTAIFFGVSVSFILFFSRRYHRQHRRRTVEKGDTL